MKKHMSETLSMCVDTIFFLPSICVLDPKNSKKNNFLSSGEWEHLDYCGLTYLDIRALKLG